VGLKVEHFEMPTGFFLPFVSFGKSFMERTSHAIRSIGLQWFDGQRDRLLMVGVV